MTLLAIQRNQKRKAATITTKIYRTQKEALGGTHLYFYYNNTRGDVEETRYFLYSYRYRAFMAIIKMHRYIHNSPLQPFSQDYSLASHTTHVVCVNFKRKWWDLQFNSFCVR